MFSGLFTRNDPVDITPNLQSKFKDFQSIFNNTSMTPEAVAEQVGEVDQSIINCAKSTKNGALTWDMYKESLNSMTLGARASQVALKGVAMVGNMAVLWAISKIISAAASIWDAANVTVQEVQEKIEGITSNLQTLNAELDELSGKSNLTEAEQNRLDYLQDRIDLEERLLKVEQERLVKETLGDPNGITDWFDDDSYVKKASREFGEAGVSRPFSIFFASNYLPSIFSDLNNIYAHFNGAESVLRNANIQYQEFDILKQNYERALQKRESSVPKSDEWNYWNTLIDEILKNIDFYKKSFRSGSYGDLLEKYNQYTIESENLQNFLDNPEYMSTSEIEATQHYLDTYSANAGKMKKMINDFAITMGDQSLWLGTDLELLDTKTDNLTAETIQSSFTDEEITILASLDFDRDASIETLQALLEQEQNRAKSFKLFSSFSLTEEQSNLIDGFQSKIKSLTGTLSAIENHSFSDSDMVDLLQEFPELAGETDHLQGAISDLSQTLLEKLFYLLGKDIPQDLRDSLTGIADEVGNTTSKIQSTAELISNIQTIGDLRHTLQEEISGGAISSSTLQSIIDKYPLLEDAVNAYCGGLLTEAQLYDLLCQQYAQDMNVFQETSRAKIYTNELFYNQCLNANSGLVNQLAEEYELDFRNFRNIEAAKLAGEQKLLGSMAGLWGEYYDIVLDKDGLYKIQGTAYSETYDVQNSAEYIEMEEKTQEIQRFLDRLNKAFRLDRITSIEFSPGALDKNLSPDSLNENSAADTEEFSEELNWVEKLIARTSSALSKLKDKIADTYISWSLRNTSLTQTMQKTKEAIKIQQQAYEKYMQKAAAVGLSTEYISKIQNGTLELETITDQALTDQIKEYESWYDKATECSDAVGDLKNQLAELARQRFDNINTYFRGLMDTTEKSISRLNTRESNSYKATDMSLYKSLYAETQTLIGYNTQKTKQLEEALDSALSGGYIEAGSQAWQDMYNEILEVRNATQEYENELNEIAQREYDALLKPFENTLTQLNHRKSIIETMTERLELQGYMASRGLYERQLREDEASLRSLTEQAEQLRQNMQDAMEKGLETGSDQWLEMQSAINENVSSTMELENNILKLKNSIRELDWEKFDRLQERLSHINGESDFLLDLFDQDDLYREDGKLNKNGNAVLGLHTRNYYTQSELAKRYQVELDKISAQLAAEPYNTTLQQRKYDLADAYRTAIKAAYEEYQAVMELGQKGYQSQIDAIQKLIDAKKRQMDADKSLYEHQKSIAEKTKNIASIQKQLSALAGDESEENKAKIQKLKVDLEEAQRDLEETTYDKWYSDQSDMLDKLAEEYEALITKQSQEEQTLFQEMISSANANAQEIQNTITDVAQKWGYRPSDDLKSAWFSGPGGVTDIGNNISQQLQQLYELNEKLYRAGAALGDLGLTDYNLETTITDETTARNFIERLYRGLLNRQPEEAGMNFWLDKLTSGATVQDMLEGFLNSPEYLSMNKSVSDTILDFYQGLLGRPAEAAGYQYWMEQYHGGMSLGEIGTHGFLDSLEFLSDKMWLALADADLLMPSLQFLPTISAPESRTSNNAGGSPSFGDIHITIPIEHVNDYNDFVTQLQKDGKFERMIQDMTLGQVLGRGSLSKNSYRF